MSRGTEYIFVETDGSAIFSEMIADYERQSGRTLQPGDPDRLVLSWVAGIISQSRVKINYAANQNIPSRACGENLDALGDTIYNVLRTPAKPAACTMKFTISKEQTSAVLIPKGVQVTDINKKLIWATTEDALVPIGEKSVEVTAQCTTAGEIGNGYVPGQINNLIDIDSIMYFSSCENTDTSNSGADVLGDNAYYSLMRQGLDAYSTAGPKGAYEYHAKAVSSAIADVCVIAPQGKAGYVNIFAIMADGEIADDGTKNAILEACNDDTVRPLTDVVEVLDPEVVEYDINLTYYVARNSEISVSDITTGVNAGVDEYIKWQRAKIGRDINPSRLMWLLRETGAKRVDIKAPVFTSLKDGSDRKTPQTARVRNVTVTNGGYEDE